MYCIVLLGMNRLKMANLHSLSFKVLISYSGSIPEVEKTGYTTV